MLRRDFGGEFRAFRGGEESVHGVAQGQGDCPPLQQSSGKRVLTHLVQQEVLLHTDGHRVPDGYSLCRAKEKQVTLCVCHFSALRVPESGSEVADGKGHRCPRPQTEAVPRQSECWLWPTRCQDPVAAVPCGGCGSRYLWR